MKASQTHLGTFSIYNDWDDTCGYQFIVMYHPAGQHCTVIMLGGQDYGGGITIYSENVPSKELDDIINKHKEDAYGMYLEVEELCKLYK